MKNTLFYAVLINIIIKNPINCNQSVEMYSQGSKVAKFGTVKSNISEVTEGRSHKSEHNRMTKISTRNNRKSRTGYYIKPNYNQRKDEIIERYNPRPYFSYSYLPPKNDNSVANKYLTNSKSTKSSYDSLLSSYNPVPSGIPNFFNNQQQRPVYTPSENGYDDTNKPVTSKQNIQQEFPVYVGDLSPESPNTDDVYRGPYAPMPPDNDNNSNQPSKDDNVVQENGDDSTEHKDSDDSNSKSPINPDQVQLVYDNPNTYMNMASKSPSMDNSNMMMLKMNMRPAKNEMAMANMMPNGMMNTQKIPEYLEYNPMDYYHGYGYDDHHHHQIYHEVTTPTTTTTTTTEADDNDNDNDEDDERVNKGHYSFYYLGRKLWYVPLFFSIYFIIYVTILILKSIARHKVQFVGNFDRNKSNARSFDLNELSAKINQSIYDTRRRYLAM